MTQMPQLWPPADPSTLSRQVWDATTARAIPGVARALGIYTLVAQCHLLHVKGTTPLEVPRFLQRPDPTMALPTFLQVHLEDFLLHGNAVHLVTARDAEGWPAAVKWYPASAWGMVRHPLTGEVSYTLYGRPVIDRDVVHVPRGADPAFPHRGMGVVEQHLRTLNRAGLQEAAESANLQTRGLPAVAIIKPNPEPDPDNDEKVADAWVEKFRGPEPKPGIFPQGTNIIPLSWNPTDAQMVEARDQSLKDIANMFNLDGYWLGAPGGSMTYKSPGPQYLTLLRTSLNTVLRTFEDVWSWSWLPYGRSVLFDRPALLRDDLLTMVQTFATGKAAGLFPDVNEAREYMGWPHLTDEQLALAAPPTPDPEPPADDPNAPTQDTEETTDDDTDDRA